MPLSPRPFGPRVGESSCDVVIGLLGSASKCKDGAFCDPNDKVLGSLGETCSPKSKSWIPSRNAGWTSPGAILGRENRVAGASGSASVVSAMSSSSSLLSNRLRKGLCGILLEDCVAVDFRSASGGLRGDRTLSKAFSSAFWRLIRDSTRAFTLLGAAAAEALDCARTRSLWSSVFMGELTLRKFRTYGD